MILDTSKFLKHRPILDPEFSPAVIWNKLYRERVNQSSDSTDIGIAIERSDGTVSVIKTKILVHQNDNISLNIKYVERLIKLLLWQRGGYKVIICGDPEVAKTIAKIYHPEGERAFDYEFMGQKVYAKKFVVESRNFEELPEPNELAKSLGRNLDGCRIGFDLGGSDRKCAAVIDGKPIHTEEVVWNPYFEIDPQYHYEGICDTLKRAADKLPRVDAIGGSAAGVYIENEVRVASLFRGVAPDNFENHVRKIFSKLRNDWNNIPFEVANDGEVTALAGSMSLNKNGVLGLSMGTSQAAGYVNPNGNITNWLNELAFVPIDYRDDAPIDEWSGDKGCGVQYFSQQGVGRLLPNAGINLPEEMSLAEKLSEVQNLMKKNDERAKKIYQTIGVYFGYSIAHYAEFYDINNLLILGRVTSGEGGEIIIDKAKEILRDEFTDLYKKIELNTPDETFKRHGQAVAAASLPKTISLINKSVL